MTPPRLWHPPAPLRLRRGIAGEAAAAGRRCHASSQARVVSNRETTHHAPKRVTYLFLPYFLALQKVWPVCVCGLAPSRARAVGFAPSPAAMASKSSRDAARKKAFANIQRLFGKKTYNINEKAQGGGGGEVIEEDPEDLASNLRARAGGAARRGVRGERPRVPQHILPLPAATPLPRADRPSFLGAVAV